MLFVLRVFTLILIVKVVVAVGSGAKRTFDLLSLVLFFFEDFDFFLFGLSLLTFMIEFCTVRWLVFMLSPFEFSVCDFLVLSPKICAPVLGFLDFPKGFKTAAISVGISDSSFGGLVSLTFDDLPTSDFFILGAFTFFIFLILFLLLIVFNFALCFAFKVTVVAMDDESEPKESMGAEPNLEFFTSALMLDPAIICVGRSGGGRGALDSVCCMSHSSGMRGADEQGALFELLLTKSRFLTDTR